MKTTLVRGDDDDDVDIVFVSCGFVSFWFFGGKASTHCNISSNGTFSLN